MKCGDPTGAGGPGHRRNGLPCNRERAPGMTRCNLHGGANPAAKIKSEQMLAQARLPACEALFEIIDRWHAEDCLTCGYPKAGDIDTTKTIIRACQVILDRTGIGPRSTVETVPQKDGDLDLDLLTDDEMARLDFLLGEVKILKTNIRVRLAQIAHPDAASTAPASEVH